MKLAAFDTKIWPFTFSIDNAFFRLNFVPTAWERPNVKDVVTRHAIGQREFETNSEICRMTA